MVSCRVLKLVMMGIDLAVTHVPIVVSLLAVVMASYGAV